MDATASKKATPKICFEINSQISREEHAME
jgi:hypothetical protein